jgi:hypothetical protein
MEEEYNLRGSETGKNTTKTFFLQEKSLSAPKGVPVPAYLFS